MLAFEKEIIAWAERDVRRVEVPHGTNQETRSAPTPILLEDLQLKLRSAQPEFRPTTVTLQNDPAAAITFSAGRTSNFYANPYTSEIRQPQSLRTARFMQTMVEWHRYLGFSSETARPRGKLVTGIANLAFCVLAVSGLYLWMPRNGSWRALRPGVWFTQNLTAKARDFNWHNVIGFWCAPVLIVLTLTAVPISFRWGASLLYTFTGTALPATGPASSGAPPPAATVPAPGANATPLTASRLLATVQSALPGWKSITWRLSPSTSSGPSMPATFQVRETRSWPRTATTTLQLDPFTGEILRSDGYANFDPARQLRVWSRFLHTGEAIGWPAQLVAGLACLGGCFLVYTGFALSWRRFFGKKSPIAAG